VSNEERIATVLRAVAEPLIVLAGAFALTLVLTLPFMPKRAQVEVPLRPQPEGGLAHDELEREVERLGFAEEASVLLVGGTSRLVLAGAGEGDEFEAELIALLERSGYQPDELTRREVLYMEGMLRGQSRTLPLVMSIQAAVFIFAGLLLARWRLSHERLEPRMSRPLAVAAGVAAGGVIVVMNGALGALLWLLGLPAEEQAWLVELYSDPAALVRIAPWVVVIAPISEEIFFRFYIFRFIARGAGFPAGVIASSLMFTVIHFNPSGFLIYLGIGCVLAWVYHRTGRLIAPIVAHATLNGIALLLSSLGLSPEP
jgi:membrane protease YdiL (CAAX protease family)